MVIYRTLLFYNFVFLGKHQTYLNLLLSQTYLNLYLKATYSLFYDFYDYGFPQFSHIQKFRSIIDFA